MPRQVGGEVGARAVIAAAGPTREPSGIAKPKSVRVEVGQFVEAHSVLVTLVAEEG